MLLLNYRRPMLLNVDREIQTEAEHYLQEHTQNRRRTQAKNTGFWKFLETQ